MSSSNEAYFTLNITTASRRDIDLATTRVLHITDCLSTFADNHADCIARNHNAVVDLLMRVLTTTAAQLFDTDTFLITFHNLLDKITCMLLLRRIANQVHGSHAIDALVLGGDIDMAATAVLQVSNSLTSTTNDQPNRAIWDEDL